MSETPKPHPEEEWKQPKDETPIKPPQPPRAETAEDVLRSILKNIREAPPEDFEDDDDEEDEDEDEPVRVLPRQTDKRRKIDAETYYKHATPDTFEAAGKVYEGARAQRVFGGELVADSRLPEVLLKLPLKRMKEGIVIAFVVPDMLPSLRQFFADAGMENDFERLRALLPETALGKLPSRDASRPFRHEVHTLSDATLETMARRHMDAFSQREREFHEKILPAAKLRFLERFDAFARTHPLPLTRKEVEQRLDEMAIQLADALIFRGIRMVGGDRDGDYDDSSDTMRVIDAYLDDAHQDQFDDIFSHELIHGLAGKTFMEEQIEGEYVGSVMNVRGGLQFDVKRKDRFRWLNEAVTEEITLRMVKKTDGSYRDERRLLQLLQTTGKEQIDFQRFTDAYFESYDPKKPSDTRLVGWKSLRHALNEAFDPAFLLRIDAFVSTHGAEEAVRVIEASGWQVIGERKKREEEE